MHRGEGRWMLTWVTARRWRGVSPPYHRWPDLLLVEYLHGLSVTVFLLSSSHPPSPSLSDDGAVDGHIHGQLASAAPRPSMIKSLCTSSAPSTLGPQLATSPSQESRMGAPATTLAGRMRGEGMQRGQRKEAEQCPADLLEREE